MNRYLKHLMEETSTKIIRHILEKRPIQHLESLKYEGHNVTELALTYP